MFVKVLGFLAGVAVLGVALGIVGLLWPGVLDAQTAPSASRTIDPDMVSAAGDEVVITITTSGSFDGQITETLPAEFTYVTGSVTEGVRARVDGGDLVLTLRRTAQFSYTVEAGDTSGSFSGELRYLDNSDNLQPPPGQDGIAVTGPTDVTVGTSDGTPTPTATSDPTPTPTTRPTSTPRPTPGRPTGLGAARAIDSERVVPGGEVMVTITTNGFTGQITETLPTGFSYKADSVTPDDIRVRTQGQDVVFTIRGTEQFSYTVTASDMVDGYSFSGSLTYLDNNDEPQPGGMVTGHTKVAVAPAGISLDRAFNPAMVSPGREVVVAITSGGFSDGQITERLPNGFSYKADSVTPDDIRVRTQGQDVVFTIRGTTRFSYTVTASSALGDHPFSGSLMYLDDNDDLQPGGPVTGTDTVTVRMAPTVAPTSTPTPEPTRRTPTRRRGGGGGGGGGGYAPPVVTATPMPTRAPSAAVATIVPTPTPIIVPTIIAPTVAPTPEPTAKPEPTAVPPTAVPTPRPTAKVVVPTVVAPTKAPEPTAMPKPTAVPPTAAPPTEVPPTAMVEPTEPPAPTATIAPTVAPVTPVTPDEGGMPTWLIILIIVIIVGVVIAAVGFYMMRMRR